MSTIHNERLLITTDRNNAIKSATVFPIEYLTDTDARQLPPCDLDSTELTALKDLFTSATISQRDQLQVLLDASTNQVTHLTSQRDDALRQIASLQAELDAIRNPPGPDLSTIVGVKAYISQARYARETSGFMVENQTVSTQRDEIGHWFPRYYDASQWLAGDAMIRAINPEGLYPYKPKDGEPVILSAAQVVRAYHCMAWYVNACFAVEAMLYAQLEGGASFESMISAANDDAMWPQKSFTWQPPT